MKSHFLTFQDLARNFCFGVLEDGEVELSVGKVFLAPAGVKHSIRSDSEIYVTAFLVPAVKKGE